MTVSNTKISDLTVCKPQIKTQVICLFFFLFLLTQNRGLAPMALIAAYLIISPGLRYHECHLERCPPDDPCFLHSSEPGFGLVLLYVHRGELAY